MASYVPIWRRRRRMLTDYRARRRLVLSGKPLARPVISNMNILVQLSLPKIGGDEVKAAVSSKELSRLGWKGSRKSTPAAYLTGLLAGKTALREEINEAVLDAGVKGYVKGSRVAAVLKGLRDAGVKIHCDEKTFPSPERIRGEHIASYAAKLSGEGADLYKRRFSELIRRQFKPQSYPQHFDEIKERLLVMSGAE